MTIYYNISYNQQTVIKQDRLHGQIKYKMKGKFKRPLTINIVDDNQESPSPSHNESKQIQQFPSTNPIRLTNQDEEFQDREDEDQPSNLAQRAQNRQGFSHFQPQNAARQNKSNKLNRLNVIEFQQFTIDANDSKEKNDSHRQDEIMLQRGKPDPLGYKKNKKQFCIEIPENEQSHCRRQRSSNSSHFLQQIQKQKNLSIKEPPAPSNKTRAQRSANRNFIFPTTDQQVQTDSHHTKSRKNSSVPISQEYYSSKAVLTEINNEWKAKVDDLNRSFQKQRQQFYKEKSNLEKDLMIKDGQIQMLQKLITNRYSPKQSTSSFSNQIQNSERYQEKIERNSSNHPKKTPSDQQLSYGSSELEKVNSLQAILNEKDVQIYDLLDKINELSLKLQTKATEIENLQIDTLKMEKLNESLKNQIYIYEKRQESQQLTKKFYQVKRNDSSQPRYSVSRTPKNQHKSKWMDIQFQQKSKEKDLHEKGQQHHHPEVALRGIDDLHKRLQSLKMNRMELESRGKIKSEIGYSQTSKHKPKGMFDFKGKIYDRDRDYVNHSRLY